MDQLFQEISRYQTLSITSIKAFCNICNEQTFSQGSFLQRQNEQSRYVYFILEGLVGYYTSNRNGNITFKMFFAENSFVASTAALISGSPSHFDIVALEDCKVIRYSAAAFRTLYQTHHDIALFHINYLEENWVVKKEPLDIAQRNQTARERYIALKESLPFYPRLKIHQIASYLGITPTQLSRIRKNLKLG